MAKVSNYKCAVIGCGEALSERARTNICPKCQGVARYWQHENRGATPAERLSNILARQVKLRLWQSRMIYLGGVNKDYAKAKRAISASLPKGD